MRHVFGLLTAVVFTAGVSIGITHSVMQEEVSRVKVNAFNDGFTDGACHKGQDGFGTSCK